MKSALAAALLLALPVGAQIPDTLTHSVPAPIVPSQTTVQFGFSVAVDNNYTVVGSPSDDLGDPDSGVVRVYNSSGVTLRTLLNPRRRASDNFGTSVAIAYPFVVVGAPGDDTGALNAGRVYVYDLSAPNDPPRILVSPNPQAGAEFGGAVAIWVDGTGMIFRIAVGAAKYDVGLALNVGQASVFSVDFNTASDFSHVATLNKPVPVADDRFGSSVAIGGTRVVAGAFFDDTGAPDAGSAYVYDISGGSPGSPVTLDAANLTINNPAAAVEDFFGYSVAMSGDRVVIGAYADGTNYQGAAFVYSLTGVSSATLTHTLENPTPVLYDRFGASVAISGTRVVVGADGDDAGATSDGSVYVYDVLNSTPTLVTVSNPAPAISDHFGAAVAISGTRMAVGASDDDATAVDSGSVSVYNLGTSTATAAHAALTPPPDGTVAHGTSVAVSGPLMVVGSPLTNYLGGLQVGRAYVYDLTSATPAVPVATLMNPNPEGAELFGQSVAISGTRVVVGVPYDYNNAIGKYSGRAYVYDLSTITPEENPVVILNNPSSGNAEYFGWSVAISGTRVVVGATDFTAGTAPNLRLRAGRAYVFDVSADFLTPALTFILENPNRANSWAADDYFGTSVAISDTRVAVGAPYFDAGASGGTQQAGKVYLYDVSGTPTQANLPPSGSVTKAPASVTLDYFGTSVAISGTRLIVGTPNADLGATNAGRAHAYDVTTLATPTLIAHLDHPSGGAAANDQLGFFVAVDGTRAVVTAAYDDAGAADSGTAYVYDLTGTPVSNSLVPTATLNNPAPALNDHFGWAVAISGTTVVVGTPDNDDANGTNNGAAYVFGTNVPDIVVEQPVGTNLPSGTGSVAFGNVDLGTSSVATTFTITNTGPASLTITSVSTTGGNAAEFAVTTAGMLTTIPAGGSTTFSVTFTPAAPDARTTTLRIINSDGDEGTFDITLTGTGMDVTPPVISGTPANITAQATGPAGAVVNFTNPTATDAVDGSVPVTCTPTSGSTFAIGTTTVTCTASDTRGNTASTSFTVTVQDTTPPVISGTPSNITAQATGPSGAVVTFASPTASDIVDGARTVTCSPASGSTFAIGTTTVTCSASDTRGNTASASFTVTVQDTTPPVISGVPANITTEATGPTGKVVTFTSPTASDLVDGSRTVTCSPASGSTFAIGTTTVTCTASDTRGNTASASFTVTVQDTTPPVISGVPSNITTEATGPTGKVVTFTSPTASDIVDGSRTVTCSPASGSTFAIGTTTVTCTASDTRGNTASASFTVTVQDTTPPVISGVPANITTEATGPTGKVVTFTSPTASDLVDGSRAVTCTPASGSTFAIGTTTVTCSASDTRGNSGSATFTVTVQDTTVPAGGTMTMSPASPVDASATLTVSFSSWTDAASTPLSYSVLIDNVVVSAQGPTSSRTVTAPSTIGAHTLKGRIYDARNNLTEVTQSFTVNSAQQSWRKLHFGSTANSGNGADGADPDFDGIRNLLEFALGTNPMTPNNGSQLPQPVRAGGNLTLSVTQPPGVSGITYGAQISTTMQSPNWTSSGVTDTDPSDTVYTFSAPFGSNLQMFMRIVITNTVD